MLKGEKMHIFDSVFIIQAYSFIMKPRASPLKYFFIKFVYFYFNISFDDLILQCFSFNLMKIDYSLNTAQP